MDPDSKRMRTFDTLEGYAFRGHAKHMTQLDHWPTNCCDQFAVRRRKAVPAGICPDSQYIGAEGEKRGASEPD